MSRFHASALLLSCLALAPSPPVRGAPAEADVKEPVTAKKPTRTDRFGDPLPPGAIARLGSVRFRQGTKNGRASAAFAPDGKSLAVTFSDEEGSGIRILAVPSGRLIRRLEAPGKGELDEVVFSPDCKVVAVRCDERIFLWETATGKRLGRFLEKRDDVHCFAFLPKGKKLVTGGVQRRGEQPGLVRIWDLKSGEVIRELKGHKTPVDCLILSRDGKQLISCGMDQTVREKQSDVQVLPLPGSAMDKREGDGDRERSIPGTIRTWELASGKLLGEQKTKAIWAEFSNDGKTYVARAKGSRGYHVQCRETGKELFRIEADLWKGYAFSPDGRSLAVIEQFKDVRLLDRVTGKELRQFEGSGLMYPSSPCFSPDGKLLATFGVDDFGNGHSIVRLWDVASGEELRPYVGHRKAVSCVALTPDGKTAASASRDSTVRVWDAHTGKELRVYTGHGVSVHAIAISPDGKTVASVDVDGMTHLWELATGKTLKRLKPGKELKSSHSMLLLAFAPDGKTLVVHDEELRVFDVATARMERRIRGSWWQYGSDAISPDGQIVASVIWDTPFRISFLNLATGQELGSIAVDRRDIVQTVAFSPDGKLLAAGCYKDSRHVGSYDHRLRVWEVATRKELLCLKLPGLLERIAFSPDGKSLMGAIGIDSWGADPSLHFWDLRSGKEFGQLAGHLGTLSSLAFSRDGGILVTGSGDSTALVWDAKSLPRDTRRPDAGLTKKYLPGHWAKLTGADVVAAYNALWTLTFMPDEAVAFLRERVSPVPAADPKEVARLIDALNSDRFAEREKASAALETLAEQIEPTLRKTLAKPASAEVRRRVERLLQGLESPILTGTRLQSVRVTEVLEQIGTPAAIRLLEDLAKGTPKARLTQEAKASLERLARRTAVKP
jgi:WD40 repeat protein